MEHPYVITVFSAIPSNYPIDMALIFLPTTFTASRVAWVAREWEKLRNSNRLFLFVLLFSQNLLNPKNLSKTIKYDKQIKARLRRQASGKPPWPCQFFNIPIYNFELSSANNQSILQEIDNIDTFKYRHNSE